MADVLKEYAVLEFLKQEPERAFCKSMITDFFKDLSGSAHAEEFNAIMESLINKGLVKKNHERHWIRYQYIEEEAMKRKKLLQRVKEAIKEFRQHCETDIKNTLDCFDTLDDALFTVDKDAEDVIPFSLRESARRAASRASMYFDDVVFQITLVEDYLEKKELEQGENE